MTGGWSFDFRLMEMAATRMTREVRNEERPVSSFALSPASEQS